MTLGASWSGQALYALISFAFGIVGGLPALLYFRKTSKAEEFLTDVFATVVIGGIYLLSVEIGGKGQFTWYSPLFYLLGIFTLTRLKRFLFSILKRRRTTRKPPR